MESLSADNMILACKVIFSEYGIPKKIMSNTGGKFVSEKFKEFCTKLNIEHATLSLYHSQSNGQLKTCIKFFQMYNQKVYRY